MAAGLLESLSNNNALIESRMAVESLKDSGDNNAEKTGQRALSPVNRCESSFCKMW